MTERLEDEYRDESGTIIMCMYCQRAQRHPPTGTQWDRVMAYIIKRPTRVSHGLCPECLDKNFPER